METLTLILPSYNEATRLPRTFALLKAAQAEGVFQDVHLREILIVDDGSTDQTTKVAESYIAQMPNVKIIRVSPNQGKGNAIHTGLQSAQSDWCLVADADSATPWNQFKKVYAVTQQENKKIAMGSRDLPGSDVRVQQSWIRENMGKTFNLIVRMITGLPYRDTQCGFKLINRAAIQKFLPDLTVKRFAWDVEFLMFARAYGLPIAEVPIAWEHQDASRVNAVSDSLEMFFRVVQMRIRIWFLKKRK